MATHADGIVNTMANAMQSFRVYDPAARCWVLPNPEVCRVMARVGLSALTNAEYEVISPTCGACSRYLDLHCSVHGSRDYPTYE